MLRKLIPNSLTAIRLAIGSLVLTAPPPQRYWIWLSVAASATDFLDGYLARRWLGSSRAGASFDLTTDGVFFLAFVIAFWRRELWPGWLLTLILASAIPQVAAQALFLAKGRGVGSPSRFWNRLLGGYSYFSVIGVSAGICPLTLGLGQAALAWYGHSRDLLLALQSPLPPRGDTYAQGTLR